MNECDLIMFMQVEVFPAGGKFDRVATAAAIPPREVVRVITDTGPHSDRGCLILCRDGKQLRAAESVAEICRRFSAAIRGESLPTAGPAE